MSDSWEVLQTQALRVGQVKKPCIGLIQENSIENSVQDGLPYIQIPNGLCELFITYPKQPYVCLKINMCFTCCMTSSFHNLLHPSMHHVTCDCVIWCDLLCDSVIVVTLTLTLVLKIENRSKMKKKMTIKWKREIKIKSTFSDLDKKPLIHWLQKTQVLIVLGLYCWGLFPSHGLLFWTKGLQLALSFLVYDRVYCQARFTLGWKSAEWTRRWADLWNDLGFSLCAVPSVCHVVATLDEWEKVRVGVSTDWCVAIEHRRSSSIRGYLHRLSD